MILVLVNQNNTVNNNNDNNNYYYWQVQILADFENSTFSGY